MMRFSKYQFKILVGDVTLLKVTLRVTCVCVYIHTKLYYYLRGFHCLDSSFFSSKMPLHLYV